MTSPEAAQASPPLPRAARIALAAAAFAIGFARAWLQPAAVDDGFHLLRAGGRLSRGSLDAYATPPGGEGAPLLGAIAAQLGTAAPGGIETILRWPGAVALGLCTVLLLFTVAKRANAFAAVLAVAFLLLIPPFSSSFASRPDQSLAGLLFLASLCAAFEPRSFEKQIRRATLSSLASPFAIPAMAVLPFFARENQRRRIRSWIAPAVALLIVIALSLALPRGSRGEIVRGIMSGWDLPGRGLPSTANAMVSLGTGGLLLVLGLIAAARRTPLPTLPRFVHLLWAASLLATILFAKPGAFLGFMPAIAPASCLVLALLVAAIPDPRGRPGGIRRPILFALFLAILSFVLESDREDRRRDLERSRAARLAQVGAHLRERLAPEDVIASSRTGALAFFSERSVRSIRSMDLSAANEGALPKVIVFEKALLASSPDEIDLIRAPNYFPSFAPDLFRRGMRLEFQDAVWRRRDPQFRPSIAEDAAFPQAYVAGLLRGWDAHAREDAAEAARAFAAAAAEEPDGLGIAHEWSGILEELAGRTDLAALQFENAVRDPATARARGHLADRAISQGDTARADSLLAQALAWSADEAELWGTLARLQSVRGELDKAKESSTRAIRLHPANARILMNHGSILWESGEKEDAKQLWVRAVRLDSRLRGFLGKFEEAPDSAPSPPLMPLFSFAEFAPQKKERAP